MTVQSGESRGLCHTTNVSACSISQIGVAAAVNVPRIDRQRATCRYVYIAGDDLATGRY